MDNIHEKIKNERLKARLSEEEIARRLNVSRSTYQYWETKTPSVNKIKRISSALGLPEDYFFSTKDEKSDHMVNEANGHYGNKPDVNPKDLQFLQMLLKQFESRAEELKADKERLYGIIENYLNTILANSSQNKEHLLDAKKLLVDIMVPQLTHNRIALDKLAQLLQAETKQGKGQSAHQKQTVKKGNNH